MDYFFILGRNPALALAEILAVLERERLKYKIGRLSREAVILRADAAAENIFKNLGGSIKFGTVFGKYNPGLNLAKNLPPIAAKTNFGFSFYKLDETISDKTLNRFSAEMRRLAMALKKKLRENGRAARFVVSRERVLSSVIVKTNKLLTSGAEFVFFMDRSEVLWGQTLAVQEFQEYEHRDYGRPRRDILRGMLPPKIAKIIINLARVNQEAMILDPFCGSGTVLTEAAILGYKNLIGFDADKQAVADTGVNLEWIKKQYKISPNYNLKIADTRALARILPKNSVEAIVTEPFLGPLLRGGAKTDNAKKIKKELGDLYRQTFQNFLEILKPAGRVVFIFPVWRIGGELIFIDLERVLPEEFKIKNILPLEARFPEVSNRGGIIWQRPEQKVLREIFVFQKYS